MRLLKVINKKVGDKIYYQYIIIISPKIIKKLGWKKGQELVGNVIKNKLTITIK